MINQSDKELIIKFSKDQPDKNTEEYICSLFSQNEDSLEFKQFLEEQFEDYIKNNPNEDYHLSSVLERVHRMIHKNKKQVKHTVVKNIFYWYSRVAALLIIPVLIVGGIWMMNKYQSDFVCVENPVSSTIIAPLGSRINFTLPDGTNGWLNSGSSLQYNIPFTNDRNVTILGEAWFDVAHDASHPFEIAAGNTKVKVLGTKFNMEAYPEEERVEVVLEEGKVEFSVPGLSSQIEMKPNERLVFSDSEININCTDASKYTAWMEGKLVFRGDPMEEVVRRIERWYNVEVELVDEDLKKNVIRGTFQDDSVEEVFRYLSLTSPIRYRIIDREILQDGTVQKKKVMLYMKKV